MILDAKCQMIREVQMQERNAMLKELEKEDRKYDEMMERERIHAQKMEEEMERKKKEEQMIGALEILEQIELNEQVRCRY